MRNLIILNTAAALLATACADPEPSFGSSDNEVFDPYCGDHEVWREELSVSAEYVDADDPSEVSLHIQSKASLVELTGEVTIEGAAVNFAHFDGSSLYYVLIPDSGSEVIQLTGVIKCTTESDLFRLTLSLHPEAGEVAYTIEYGEIGDAGDDPDGGD